MLVEWHELVPSRKVPESRFLARQADGQLARFTYTPISAVLKRAGVERQVKRPKGWRGSKATSWLEPAAAFAVVDEAYRIDPEFGLLCLNFLYTGMRLSEPLIPTA